MSKIIFKLYLLGLLFLTLSPRSSVACGFAYVTSCGTFINLKINDNPVKTYSLSNCSYMSPLDGKNFGVVDQLRIEDAVTLSWQSCTNNVMNGKLYYRTYLASNPLPGAFIAVPLTVLSVGGVGAYTDKQYSLASGLDLLNGLQAGQLYTLELYIKNDVDTNQDNLADTLLIADNGGLNFKATFQTGSTNGGILVNFPQKTNVSCVGSTNGQVTAAASGGNAPYTYNWNNGAHTASISNLSVGNYTVTATSSNGVLGIGTVTISAPTPIGIDISVSNTSSGTSNNGSLLANVSGGTPGYSYLWSNGVNTSTISALGAGSYSLTVTDANGCTAIKTANIVIAVGTPPQNYCQSYSGAPWNDNIRTISLGEINNTSSKTVYADFTGLPAANLTIGQVYPMSIITGAQYYSSLESFRVWIDSNRDGVFQASELVLSNDFLPPPPGVSQIVINQNITIPLGALAGPTRMRVSMKKDGAPTPCEQFVYGEVEDYLINIVQGNPPACQISATATNILCNNNNTPTSATDDTYAFTLNVSGTGTTWKATMDGTMISGQHGTPKVLGPFAISGGVLNFTVVDASDAQCTKVVSVTPPATCSSGGGSNPPLYCPSISANPWNEYVKKVGLGTINNLSGKKTYSNFTSLSTNLVVGQTTPIHITGGFSYMYRAEYVRVWIDMNRNGSFEANEIVFSSQLAVTNGIKELLTSGSVIIPLGTATGPTRMRVILQPISFPNGCDATIPFGEVEDYTVNIVTSAPLLTGNNNISETNFAEVENLTIYPNPLAGSELHVQLSDYMDHSAQIELFEPTGRLVDAFSIDKVTQEIYTLNVANLPNGYLILVVKSPSFRAQTKRVVVLRE